MEVLVIKGRSKEMEEEKNESEKLFAFTLDNLNARFLQLGKT